MPAARRPSRIAGRCHMACSGNEGYERQNRAYDELFRYLHDSARYRYPDMGEEVSQRALTNIFTAFERCRQPGAFLAFALQHLLDAARAPRREQQPRSLSAPAGTRAYAAWRAASPTSTSPTRPRR